MQRNWTDIGSDVNWRDYGGRWARHIAGTRYHVVRFENCAEWGDGATRYHCDLQEVDIASDSLASALQSVGCDDESPCDLAKVEALASYGAYAPLWQEAGANAHALLRAAKRESRMLATDADAYEERMERPVNAIGSTAREYAAGDLQSAMTRARPVVRVLKHSDLRKCRFFIFLPSHYRADGSCKCDDAEERARLIQEADYQPSDFDGIPLR